MTDSRPPNAAPARPSPMGGTAVASMNGRRHSMEQGQGSENGTNQAEGRRPPAPGGVPAAHQRVGAVAGGPGHMVRRRACAGDRDPLARAALADHDHPSRHQGPARRGRPDLRAGPPRGGGGRGGGGRAAGPPGGGPARGRAPRGRGRSPPSRAARDPALAAGHDRRRGARLPGARRPVFNPP